MYFHTQELINGIVADEPDPAMAAKGTTFSDPGVNRLGASRPTQEADVLGAVRKDGQEILLKNGDHIELRGGDMKVSGKRGKKA